jgi:hypothetical protein
VIVAGVLCAVLGVYVVGYLSHAVVIFPAVVHRRVVFEWEVTLYAPAAWAESLLWERRVVLVAQSRWWQLAPYGPDTE